MRYIAIYIITAVFFSSCITTIEVPHTSKNPYPQTIEEIKALNSKIEKAYYSLLGTFFSQNQVDSSVLTLSDAQVLRSVPIWSNQNQSYWFCMALYTMSNPQEPIFSGVFQLQEYITDTLKLNYYTLPKSAHIDEIWTNDNFLSDYSLSDLIPKKDCSSLLVYQGNDIFKMVNDSIPCSHTISSSSIRYLDMNISLSPSKQVHTNIYYDKNKKTSISYPQISYNRERKLGRD